MNGGVECRETGAVLAEGDPAYVEVVQHVGGTTSKRLGLGFDHDATRQ